MMRNVISLGCSCNIAMQLEKYNLRKHSMPFDWLLNCSNGLGNIKSIIENDFHELRDSSDYIESQYPGFGNKKLVVPKNYPTLAFLHQNPILNPDDLTAFNRRIDRFLRAVNAGDVFFLYECPIKFSEMDSAKNLLIAQTRLAEELIQLINRKSNNKSHILLLFSVGDFKSSRVIGELLKGFSCPENVTCDYVYDRSDKNKFKRARWNYRYSVIFKKHKITSFANRIYNALLLYRFEKIYRIVRRKNSFE